jgi:hypothetical protein
VEGLGDGWWNDQKIVKSWISTNTKGFGLGVQWVGLQNPIFGLRKISLVIGLKVKGKMFLGETYNGFFKCFF